MALKKKSKRKNDDNTRYMYAEGFRINRKTGVIISLVYHDNDNGGTVKLTHDPKNKIQNTKEKIYTLPYFKVNASTVDDLRGDPAFQAALKFKEGFKRENHAKMKRAKARVDWLNHFQDNEKKLDSFIEWKKAEKETSKRQLDTEYSYIRNYVYPFFLSEKALVNPKEWHIYHNSFKEWLQTKEPHRYNTKGKTLAINTINNIIATLNNFYNYLEADSKSAGAKFDYHRCKPFPKKLASEKGTESVIKKEHAELIVKHLKKLTKRTKGGETINNSQRELLATFFKTLMATGLRKNEALGISIGDIKVGKVDLEQFGYINDFLKDQDVPFYGYIYLLDQPGERSIRAKNGKVPRKRLKHRKSIDPRYARYIPILDKEVALELRDLIKAQITNWKKKKFGTNERDYLLFDGLSYQSLNLALTQIYQHKDFKKIHHYTPHDCRHTYVSEHVYYPFRGNLSIVSKITGHSRQEVIETYLHLYKDQEVRGDIENWLNEVENMDDEIEAI